MSENRRLDSWKEIAGYVGRTEKTIQRYEKAKHFPIHRIGGGIKERVFAFTNEIDAWFREQQDASGNGICSDHGNQADAIWQDHAETTREASGSFHYKEHSRLTRGLLAWILGISALLLVSGAVIWSFQPQSSQKTAIERVTVSGHTLSAYKEGGEFLWERKFESPPNGEPSLEIIISSRWTPGYEKCIAVDDLDRDGRREVLVVCGSAEPDFSPYSLQCLDEIGNPRWQFQPGESIVYGGKTIDKLWKIDFFLIDDLDQDGQKEIVVSAHHRNDFPAKISVLKPCGDIVGQYYNSGRVESVVICDLEGDGKREIICGGTNNEYMKGTLFVLDCNDVAGSSPQSKEKPFYSGRLPTGREKYYILLPRDCVNRAVMRLGVIGRVLATGQTVDAYVDSSIPNFNPSAVIFSLDHNMKLARIRTNLEYAVVHRHLSNQGILDHPFSESELQLMEPLQYWNGREFTPEPAPSSQHSK